MMKRYFVLLLFCFSALLLPAQDSSFSDTFIKSVREDSARMSFSWKISMDGKKYSGSGRVVIQKCAYVLKTDILDVFDDGRSLWTVNRSSREVVGEPSANVDFLADPSAILAIFGFDPEGAGISIKNNSKGHPSSIHATLKNSASADIAVYGITFGEKEDDDFFSFDPDSLDSSYFVTDLR